MLARQRFALVVALLCAAGIAATAQTPPRLTFEVASIHPSKPDQPGGYVKALPGGMGYSAQNMPLGLIFALMYKVPVRQISSAPDWFQSAKFDIEARTDRAYTVDELHAMMISLITDRCGLRFHIENREGNVYALTVDKSGTRMKPDDAPEDFTIPITYGPKGAIGHRVSLVYLTWWLGQQLQDDSRPVIDGTGLTGKYDFDLSYRPILPPGAPADALPPEVQDRPTLFEALRDQLGLRLTAGRGPVPYYIIEKVAMPTDN